MTKKKKGQDQDGDDDQEQSRMPIRSELEKLGSMYISFLFIACYCDNFQISQSISQSKFNIYFNSLQKKSKPLYRKL